MLKTDLQTFKRALLSFGDAERAVRDFLLLCLPGTVIKQHTKGLDEMRTWFAEGCFEHQSQAYPFQVRHFRIALQDMWDKPHFVPESKSDPTRPLRYLKQIMIGLAQKEDQARQASGIQVTPLNPPASGGKSELPADGGKSTIPVSGEQPQKSPRLRGDQGGPLAWCRRFIAQCEAVKTGFNIQPLLGRLRNALQAPELLTPQCVQELRNLLEMLILDYIGQHQADLRAEVEIWFAEHKTEWDPEIYEAAIQEGMRARVRECFALPKI